jgi:CHASE2 domain-containing sensor protein
MIWLLVVGIYGVLYSFEAKKYKRTKIVSGVIGVLALILACILHFVYGQNWLSGLFSN